MTMQQGSSSGLEAALQLPGGYTTTRRSALKAAALLGGLGSLYVLLTRAKVGYLAPPSALSSLLVHKDSQSRMLQHANQWPATRA